MKHIYIVIFIILISSCNRHEETLVRMKQIADISNHDANCALHSLDSLNMKEITGNEKLHKKYDLLRTRILDKLYISATTDSVIKPVVEYYDKNGTKREQQEAHYYAASVYRDLHNTPRSLYHFLRSIEAATAIECDSLLLRNTYSQLYLLYYRVQNYTLALDAALKECEVARAIDLLDALSLLHVAVTYEHLAKKDLAKKYLDLTRKCINKVKTEDKTAILTDLLYYYSTDGHITEAEQTLEILRKECTTSPKEELSIGLAAYYEKKGYLDSAIYYQQIILDTDCNIANQYDAAEAIFKLNIRAGRPTEALLSAELFANLCDSVNLSHECQMAMLVQHEYQYSRDTKAELEMMQQNAKLHDIVLGIAMTSVILILLLILFLFHRRHKHIKQMLYRMNELHNLRASLAKIDQELKETERHLNERTTQMKQIIQILHKDKLESHSSDIISVVQEAAKGIHKMDEKEWKDLYIAVNTMYPNFGNTYILKDPKSSEEKLRVAYLMKIGLTNPQIHNITDIPNVTLWRWTKKINELMSDEWLDVTNKSQK